MNGDFVRSRWRDVRRNLVDRWGGLTESELDRIHDNWLELESIVMNKYGTSINCTKRIVYEFEAAIELSVNKNPML